MMASSKTIWLLLAVVCWFACAEASERYRRQIPTNPIAVDAALRNPRFMRRQISCLLNEAPCDNIGRPLKQMMPSLIRGQCPGCTEEQYRQAMKVMATVSSQYPNEYSRIYYTYTNVRPNTVG